MTSSPGAPGAAPGRVRALGVATGLITAFVALGVAQLVAGITGPQGSPVVAVGGAAIDAQWDTPFLRSLGAAPVAREHYLALLGRSAAPVRLATDALPALRLLPALP